MEQISFSKMKLLPLENMMPLDLREYSKIVCNNTVAQIELNPPVGLKTFLLRQLILIVVNDVCKIKLNNTLEFIVNSHDCNITGDHNQVTYVTTMYNYTMPFPCVIDDVRPDTELNVYNYYDQERALSPEIDDFGIGSELIIKFPKSEYSIPQQCWVQIDMDNPLITVMKYNTDGQLDLHPSFSLKRAKEKLGRGNRPFYYGILKINWKLVGMKEKTEEDTGHNFQFYCHMSRCNMAEDKSCLNGPIQPVSLRGFQLVLPKRGITKRDCLRILPHSWCHPPKEKEEEMLSLPTWAEHVVIIMLSICLVMIIASIVMLALSIYMKHKYNQRRKEADKPRLSRGVEDLTLIGHEGETSNARRPRSGTRSKIPYQLKTSQTHSIETARQ